MSGYVIQAATTYRARIEVASTQQAKDTTRTVKSKGLIIAFLSSCLGGYACYDGMQQKWQQISKPQTRVRGRIGSAQILYEDASKLSMRWQ